MVYTNNDRSVNYPYYERHSVKTAFRSHLPLTTSSTQWITSTGISVNGRSRWDSSTTMSEHQKWVARANVWKCYKFNPFLGDAPLLTTDTQFIHCGMYWTPKYLDIYAEYHIYWYLSVSSTAPCPITHQLHWGEVSQHSRSLLNLMVTLVK